MGKSQGGILVERFKPTKKDQANSQMTKMESTDAVIENCKRKEAISYVVGAYTKKRKQNRSNKHLVSRNQDIRHH
jgi:hypothetical protein